MTEEKLLARKYARAFLQAFGDNLTIQNIKTLEHALLFLQNRKASMAFIKIPTLSFDEKRILLEKLLQSLNLVADFKKIIALLVAHRRLDLVPEFCKQVIKIYKQKNAIEEIIIKTSHTLDQKQLEHIKHIFEQKTGKHLICQYSVDPALIAGIRVQGKSFLWEYSLAKQLRTAILPFISKDFL